MESLSRPFHSRKLSNPTTTTTFSPKKPHDGVFSGHRHTYAGASPIDVQDYREIFGSSPAVSSIPVLDLSTLREPSDALNLNLNLKYRSSRPEPDYSTIFRCFPDDDVAVSCEKSFARDKPRSPSSKTSSSPDSDNFSHQSSDVLNRFNMSYNKISQKSKDGLDGTKHVTQFHAVPGFTRFIDEEAVPPLMEAKKHESFKSFDNLSTVSSPTTVTNRKDYPKRSTANNSSGTFSPVYVDVNSAASTSAAALKQAIEKAQESIRIAKESVGRKKKGLRSFSSKSMKDVTANEEHKYKDEVRQVFQRAAQDVGSRSRKYFMDSEKLFGVKKVLDEINGKISESNNLTVPQKVEEDEMKVPEESNQNEKHEETCDYNLQESKESVESCDNRLEESEVILQDEDNFCDQEVDENLSFDKKKSDEIDSEDDIHVASNIEMDNNVETIQETITVFAEIGTEENDFQSESELEEEEEEKEKEKEEEEEEEEISEIESTNEIQNEEERIDEVAGEENKERVDEVAAREREREKDRLAVDRAIREARERARERAERVAVEKATEEIRQRMRADANEKAAKASAQSKLRAERAAVERATSEARQRALEKAMTKKPLYDSRKAKLEKDNKIMERAAKALAEKEKRDLLAQKEQAERNRLAENLDADIKKWSSGKEGNLRALLSTLQYILGVESGWQPVTLTEIVATSAVKKAYRKATLCVHPDKLQQRGASIQQKYICEKVFDLLKAAWSKFNSEER